MLRFKPDVRIGYFDERLYAVLRLVSSWSLRARVDVRITSIEDSASVHLPPSLHRFGLAVDLAVVSDDPTQHAGLADFLRCALDPQYDLVVERDHSHVEWDAHRPPLQRTTP